MKHPQFICRTVLVKNNNVEESMSLLNKILGREGVFTDARRYMFYEKPWQTLTMDAQLKLLQEKSNKNLHEGELLLNVVKPFVWRKKKEK